MKFFYIIYQICVWLPIFLVTTILTALVTMIGCRFGNGHFWGYYPGKIWSQITCYTLLLPIKVVGRENIDKKQSYVFVANHQGSFDIFLIYGFLGRNFKWMMKKSLRKLPFVGKACESAGFIFVDKSGPRKIHETIEQAFHVLKDGTSLVVFPEGARTFTGHMGFSERSIPVGRRIAASGGSSDHRRLIQHSAAYRQIAVMASNEADYPQAYLP